MRRVTLSLTVSIVALALASGVALAQVVTCPMGGGLCVGTDDNDILNGTNLADDMRGLKGQDTLNAAADFDLLAGGRGNDILKGEADNDSLSGDLGDDTLLGGPGDDEYRFTNGWGRDRISDATQGMAGERLTFSLVTRPVKMDLISRDSRPEVESGANTLNFGPNVEVNSIDGSSSDDHIKGDNGKDSINGIQGNDTIRSRAGVDDVMGMDGRDNLFGGSGGDNFDAGKGADVVYAVDGEADQIMCGPGDDIAFRDAGLDVLQGCEDPRP
jgi:Ca2+-binding RTX toxin-like protein